MEFDKPLKLPLEDTVVLFLNTYVFNINCGPGTMIVLKMQ